MKLDDIKTVDDLLKQNEQTETERLAGILNTIIDEGPEVGLMLSTAIISKLAEWHEGAADDKMEENDAESAVLWAVDASKLQQAVSILKEIEI